MSFAIPGARPKLPIDPEKLFFRRDAIDSGEMYIPLTYFPDELQRVLLESQQQLDSGSDSKRKRSEFPPEVATITVRVEDAYTQTGEALPEWEHEEIYGNDEKESEEREEVVFEIDKRCINGA